MGQKFGVGKQLFAVPRFTRAAPWGFCPNSSAQRAPNSQLPRGVRSGQRYFYWLVRRGATRAPNRPLVAPNVLAYRDPHCTQCPTPTPPSIHLSFPSAQITDSAYIVGSSSPHDYDWFRGTTGGIRTHIGHFVNGYGRVCNLCGINLSGNCMTCVDYKPVFADGV